MKWNSYGFIIFSFVLTTTIEARGGGSRSSSSGWSSGRSSSSTSGRNTVSGNSPGYWSRSYDSSGSNTYPSYQHTPNYVNSYRSRPSATSGSNDFMHGFATGNFLSHGLPSYRTPAYHNSNNWESHTSLSDDTSGINPPESRGSNELLDFLNELNKPTNTIESMNSVFEKIAKIDFTKALRTHSFAETAGGLASSEATPETATIAMPTMDTANINELLDFLNELNKPTNTIESMNSVFEKIAKIDFTKALRTHSFAETAEGLASSAATPETTTIAMPTSVAETTVAIASSEATTDLPFDFQSFTMKPIFSNAELTLISQDSSTGDMKALDLDTEYYKLLLLLRRAK